MIRQSNKLFFDQSCLSNVNILTYANLGRPQLSSSKEKKPFLKTLIGIGKNKKTRLHKTIKINIWLQLRSYTYKKLEFLFFFLYVSHLTGTLR